MAETKTPRRRPAKKTASAKKAAEDQTPVAPAEQDAGPADQDQQTPVSPDADTGGAAVGDATDEAKAPEGDGQDDASQEPIRSSAAAPTVQAAPLEPPATPEPPAPDDPDNPGAAVPPSLAAAASRTDGEELFDEATGECPDPDKLFTRVFERGSLMKSHVRLMVRSTVPGRRDPSVRLVMPKGARLSAPQAERIKAAVRRQAEAQK